ncbi:MAG: phosphoribosylanthranilate isomerase [Planctomycetota bacterium]
MFRVKICGITTVADAEAVAETGADAIGLNFFPKSPRYVNPTTAKKIVSAVKQQLSVVGVFVNATLDEMLELADGLPLDYIQLHGDEPISRLSQLAPRRTIRVLRLRPDRDTWNAEFLRAVATSRVTPAGVLVDAYQPGNFGGTGQMVDWGKVRDVGAAIGGCPVLLAGGLNPDNVDDAIRHTGCDGVDVASGVELKPGVKDMGRTRHFVASALGAFGERV